MILPLVDVVTLYTHIGLLQIGCTKTATYFLVDGKMYGCGKNSNSELGVGNNGPVKKPTAINTEGHE